MSWVPHALRFRRIFPGICAKNCFDSSSDYDQNPNAQMIYGPTDNFTKSAPFYQLKIDEEKTERSELKSSIGGKTINEDNKSFWYSLVFSTSYEDNNFTYVVSNKSENDLYFSMSSLHSAWEKFSDEIKLTAKWDSNEKNFFFIKSYSISQHVVFAPSVEQLTEQQVMVEIMTENFEVIAEGLVSGLFTRISR